MDIIKAMQGVDIDVTAAGQVIDVETDVQKRGQKTTVNFQRKTTFRTRFHFTTLLWDARDHAARISPSRKARCLAAISMRSALSFWAASQSSNARTSSTFFRRPCLPGRRPGSTVASRIATQRSHHCPTLFCPKSGSFFARSKRVSSRSIITRLSARFAGRSILCFARIIDASDIAIPSLPVHPRRI